MSTRIVIDTNIIIPLEENAPVSEALAQLLSLLQTNGVHVLVHPASFKDVENDKDPVRREIQLSKLKKYGQLQAPPELDQALFKAAGIIVSSGNDTIDCTILTALAKDAIHFLVTEDRGLHSKARRLNLGDRVLTIEQAFTLFNAALAKQPIELPNLELIYLHEIRDELSNAFFDTLRADYQGFDDWFIRSCQQGRQAWIARDSVGNLGAICIYKDEVDEQVASASRLKGSILKLCTFKVERNVRGQKIGELLLKSAFRHASLNGHEHIYVTAKTKQTDLIEMLTEFGFESVGIAENQDTVFVKDHPPKAPASTGDPVDYHVKYAPFFMAGPDIGKFIVPIQPDYHEQLFPDLSDRQLKLSFAATSPGNAIKLAYLCRANTNAIKPGDILIFYRSTDSQQCTTIGIVETVDRLADADMILERVLKRTVYTRQQIETISDGGCLVILFRLQAHLPRPVKRASLTELDIKGPIQTIRKINDDQFSSIAKLAGAENSISAN